MTAAKRRLISAFIVFHWTCVAAWIWPNPSDLKTFLMSIRAPLPIHAKSGWTMESRPGRGLRLPVADPAA